MPYLTPRVRELAAAKYMCKDYVRKLSEDTNIPYGALRNAVRTHRPDPVNAWRVLDIHKVLGGPVQDLVFGRLDPDVAAAADAHGPTPDGTPSRPPEPRKTPKPDPKRDQEKKGPKRLADRLAS